MDLLKQLAKISGTFTRPKTNKESISSKNKKISTPFSIRRSARLATQRAPSSDTNAASATPPRQPLTARLRKRKNVPSNVTSSGCPFIQKKVSTAMGAQTQRQQGIKSHSGLNQPVLASTGLGPVDVDQATTAATAATAATASTWTTDDLKTGSVRLVRMDLEDGNARCGTFDSPFAAPFADIFSAEDYQKMFGSNAEEIRDMLNHTAMRPAFKDESRKKLGLGVYAKSEPEWQPVPPIDYQKVAIDKESIKNVDHKALLTSLLLSSLSPGALLLPSGGPPEATHSSNKKRPLEHMENEASAGPSTKSRRIASKLTANEWDESGEMNRFEEI